MFVVKFQGALGNQMFEYAFLRKLEQIYPNNRVLGHIEKIKDFNGYELNKVFKINVPECSWQEAARYSDMFPSNGKHYKIMSRIYNFRRYVFGEKTSFIFQDDYSSFYKEIYELNPLKSYYLMGVWANEKYLEGIDDIIRNAFKFPEDSSEKNKSYIEEMETSNSVCIHVRRNEYVTNGLTVVNDDYYVRAVDYMKSKVENPKFFVFSDDHKYCKTLFENLINYTMVEGNTGENSFRDLELMTHCKHNIIANSTFSFWGAYLGTNKEKIVIAPNVSWGKCKNPFACKNWIIFNSD